MEKNSLKRNRQLVLDCIITREYKPANLSHLFSFFKIITIIKVNYLTQYENLAIQEKQKCSLGSVLGHVSHFLAAFSCLQMLFLDQSSVWATSTMEISIITILSKNFHLAVARCATAC